MGLLGFDGKSECGLDFKGGVITMGEDEGQAKYYGGRFESSDSSHGQTWSMWSVFVENAMSYCNMGMLPSFSRFFRSRLEVKLLK